MVSQSITNPFSSFTHFYDFMLILLCYTLHTEVYILFCEEICISGTLRFDPTILEFYFFFMKQNHTRKFPESRWVHRSHTIILALWTSFFYIWVLFCSGCMVIDQSIFLGDLYLILTLFIMGFPVFQRRGKGTPSISSHVTEVRLWYLRKTLSGKKIKKGIVVECYQLTMHGHCVFSSP